MTGVVDAGGVMAVLLEAAPDFAAGWDEAANVEDGRRLLYLDVSDLVRHVVDAAAAGETGGLPVLFAAVEHLVVQGDDEVRDLLVVGFLESLQTQSARSPGVDAETTFRPLLGPVSERWWARLDRFWDGEVDALRVDEP